MPHLCRARKLLLLIIFPLNAVGSTFSFGTTSIFLLLDSILTKPTGFHILRYADNLIFVCLFVYLFNQTPHFWWMRKLLLLIIFPLNAVGSTFSQALLLLSYLDPIPSNSKNFHILHYREKFIFVCLFGRSFIWYKVKLISMKIILPLNAVSFNLLFFSPLLVFSYLDLRPQRPYRHSYFVMR